MYVFNIGGFRFLSEGDGKGKSGAGEMRRAVGTVSLRKGTHSRGDASANGMKKAAAREKAAAFALRAGYSTVTIRSPVFRVRGTSHRLR